MPLPPAPPDEGRDSTREESKDEGVSGKGGNCTEDCAKGWKQYGTNCVSKTAMIDTGGTDVWFDHKPGPGQGILIFSSRA